MIEAEGLKKHFGDVEALAGLDLAVPSGKVLAVLGPNGAGKTTLIRTIATLTQPSAGTLKVAGIDVAKHPKQVRRSIGLAGQYAAVEPAMTGRENLRMVARLFGHDRDAGNTAADAVLDQRASTDAGDRMVRAYSGGMRRRLDLGASLVGAPRLLLLDEPTTGLDPGAGSSCGSRSGSWCRAAPTCCSPPSTSRRPTSSPTTSRSSTTGRWWRRAPATSSRSARSRRRRPVGRRREGQARRRARRARRLGGALPGRRERRPHGRHRRHVVRPAPDPERDSARGRALRDRQRRRARSRHAVHRDRRARRGRHRRRGAALRQRPRASRAAVSQAGGRRELGEQAIGTTGRGIGPAYEDKIARRGVRVLDLRNPERLRELVEKGAEHANDAARAIRNRTSARTSMRRSRCSSASPSGCCRWPRTSGSWCIAR